MNLPLAKSVSDGVADPSPVIGLATITRQAFAGADLTSLWQSLVKQVATDTADAGTLLDLSIIELIMGRPDSRTAFQLQALAKQRLYRLPPAIDSGRPLRLLAFMVPGDFMANTPIEFLLEGRPVQLDLLYLVKDAALPRDIPEHDIALVAIAESEANQPYLAAMQEIAKAWPKPILNAAPKIARLTRDGAFDLLHDIDGLVMPQTIRLDRAALETLAADAQSLAGLMPGATLPVIIRPVDSHGGDGLQKLAAPAELKAYLNRHAAAEFYVAPFVEYRSPDGLYRKYRLALIDGRPYGCHLAISRHWMVHYLNADMINNAINRAEEADFLTDFESGFGQRHAAALAKIAARCELDYAQIDCAETADGQLLLFEIGTAMIVHSMDPTDVFPYKKAAMEKVFAAFTEMLRARSQAQ